MCKKKMNDGLNRKFIGKWVERKQRECIPFNEIKTNDEKKEKQNLKQKSNFKMCRFCKNDFHTHSTKKI